MQRNSTNSTSTPKQTHHGLYGIIRMTMTPTSTHSHPKNENVCRKKNAEDEITTLQTTKRANHPPRHHQQPPQEPSPRKAQAQAPSTGPYHPAHPTLPIPTPRNPSASASR